jgi:hypothetical protein
MSANQIKKIEQQNASFLDLQYQIFQIEKKIQRLKQKKKTTLFLQGLYIPMDLEDLKNCVCCEKEEFS